MPGGVSATYRARRVESGVPPKGGMMAKKRGRPKGVQLPRFVGFRVTQQEWVYLKARAIQNELSISAYVRSVLAREMGIDDGDL